MYDDSDEDTDVKALVSSWLKKQDESNRDILSGFIEEFFYKALEWVLKVVRFDMYLSCVRHRYAILFIILALHVQQLV